MLTTKATLERSTSLKFRCLTFSWMTRDCRLVKRIDIFKLLSFSSTVIGHLQDDITWLHLPESLVVFMCKMGLLFSKSQREGQILMRRQKWILEFVVKPTSSWNWPIKSVQQQKGKFFFFKLGLPCAKKLLNFWGSCVLLSS